MGEIIELLKSGDVKVYVIVTSIVFSLTFAIYTILDMQRDVRVKKLKNDGRKKYSANKRQFKLKIGDSEKIRLKLVQAGSPLAWWGLDEYSYHSYKIILALLAGSSAIGDGLAEIAMYSIMGYFILDIYIKMKKRKRHKEIKNVLGTLIAITIDGLQSGQTPMEITSTLLKKLPKENPLWSELKILNLKLLKGNIKTPLDEFRERIDLEEIDNYCFSFLQYEIGGRAVTMLKLQLELINTLKANRDKRETQTRANWSSVAVAILVVVLLMIILLPLMSSFKDMPMLQG